MVKISTVGAKDNIWHFQSSEQYRNTPMDGCIWLAKNDFPIKSSVVILGIEQ